MVNRCIYILDLGTKKVFCRCVYTYYWKNKYYQNKFKPYNINNCRIKVEIRRV